MGKEEQTIDSGLSSCTCLKPFVWDPVSLPTSPARPAGPKINVKDMCVIHGHGTWNPIISNFLVNFKIPKSRVEMDFLMAATKNSIILGVIHLTG